MTSIPTSLQVATILLGSMAAYDVFWVFIQPRLSHSSSVMVEVRAAGFDAKALFIVSKALFIVSKRPRFCLPMIIQPFGQCCAPVALVWRARPGCVNMCAHRLLPAGTGGDGRRLAAAAAHRVAGARARTLQGQGGPQCNLCRKPHLFPCKPLPMQELTTSPAATFSTAVHTRRPLLYH